MGADRIVHGWDPRLHGLSLERVALKGDHPNGNAFGDMPPVGVPFVEMSALLGGEVMFSLGARLPDNHVLREGGGCARTSIIREMAAALIRAADVADSKAPLPAGHQQLADFASDAIRDAATVQQEAR